MELKKATRKKVKLRLSIAAPTGFGKTYSALLMAFGITKDWEKIAVIDTENESASLYSDLGNYFTIQLAPPYTPEKYTEAIRACENAGMEVIIIDSITHVWQGEGGLLESNDLLGGNKFQNWAKTTPRYQKWLSSILHSKCHVITTMRKKQAYSIIQDGAKTKVEKQGMEDQIRDGYDYEMTIAFELINDKHLARSSKDRTRLFDCKPEFIITPETGKSILDWCNSGVSADSIQIETNEKTIYEKYMNLLESSDLTAAEKDLFSKDKKGVNYLDWNNVKITEAYNQLCAKLQKGVAA
jgi:hypothetical protein